MGALPVPGSERVATAHCGLSRESTLRPARRAKQCCTCLLPSRDARLWIYSMADSVDLDGVGTAAVTRKPRLVQAQHDDPPGFSGSPGASIGLVRTATPGGARYRVRRPEGESCPQSVFPGQQCSQFHRPPNQRQTSAYLTCTVEYTQTSKNHPQQRSPVQVKI